MEAQEDIISCPHCHQEIDELRYRSNVIEYGRKSIWHEDGVIEGNMECDDSDCDGTTYYCPHCEAEVDEEDLIIKTNGKKDEREFKIGEIITVPRELIGFSTNNKVKIKSIYKSNLTVMIDGLNFSVKKKDAIKIEDRDKIDEGQSETDETVINTKEPETFKIDPIINFGTICPRCKHLFADKKAIERPRLSWNEDDSPEEITTCPKCALEFNRKKEYNKLINKKVKIKAKK